MAGQAKDGSTPGCCMGEGCPMAGQAKDGSAPGCCMGGGCPMGGGPGGRMMNCPMMGMMGKHTDMMLMMMEQMMEHNEAAIAARK